MEINREEILQKVEELSAEYNINKHIVLKYYNDLCTYDCYEETLGMDCLELVCQRRVSANVSIQGEKKYRESLNYSIEYSLYDVYQEKAIPCLTNDYLCQIKGIRKHA